MTIVAEYEPPTGDSAGDARPLTAGGRFKKLTDKLYQCLVDDRSCSSKIRFGARSFCAWLLRNEADQTEHNLPCNSGNKTDQPD